MSASGFVLKVPEGLHWRRWPNVGFLSVSSRTGPSEDGPVPAEIRIPFEWLVSGTGNRVDDREGGDAGHLVAQGGMVQSVRG